MTRLKSTDVIDIGTGLQEYDAMLRARTGGTLLEIACHAHKVDSKSLSGRIAVTSIGIIPMTCGQGLICGFAEAVGRITAHMGFNTFITEHTDAAGMAEAFEKKAGIIMLADDNRFVALNIKKYKVIDNAVATARGFAAGLDMMTGGVAGKKCLVIGCGPVGQHAAAALLNFGAVVSVYDRDRQRSVAVHKAIHHQYDVRMTVEESLESAFGNHRILFDATNSAGVIKEKNIMPDTFIAAPGMPLGLSDAARAGIGGRLLHDPLQTGVACMAVKAAAI